MEKLFNKICLFLLVMTMSFAGMQSVLAVKLEKLGYTATGYTYISGVSTPKDKSSTTFSTAEINILTSAVERKNGVPDPSGKNSYKTKYDANYYIHKIPSDNMYLYCLDALLPSTNDLYVGRFFFTDQDTLKPTPNSLFDFIVLYALKNGQDSDDKLVYFNKSTAVRIIATAFGFLKTDDSIPDNGFPSDNGAATYLRGAYDGMLLRWILNDQNYFNSVYGDKRSYSTSDYYDAELAEAYDFLLKTKNVGLKSIADLKANGAGYGIECENGGTACLASAKQLVKDSFKAAVEFVKSGMSNTEIKENHDVDLSPTMTSVGAKTLISKNVTHTITINNINKDKDPSKDLSFKITEIAYKEALEKYGADKQPQIINIAINNSRVCDGAEACKTFINRNIFEGRALADSIAIKIVVSVSGYQGEIKCGYQPMAYELKYTTNVSGAKNSLSDEVGIVWRNRKSNSKKQRFLSYVGKNDDANTDPDEISGKLEAEVSLIGACTCEDLEQACRNEAATNGYRFSGPACQDLKNSNCGDCTWWDLVCEINPNDPECNETEREANCTADCKASFETYWCCEEQGGIATLILDENEKEVNIKGISEDKDIKACFVTKVDAMAMGYSQGGIKNDANIEGTKDLTDSSDTNSNVTYTLGSMKANRFCTVSCKEDYIMRMPTAKLVNAGRYFTFSASIDGTKTCYTDTINSELFEKEIDEAQKAMINAFNEWSRLNALATTPRTSLPQDVDWYDATCTTTQPPVSPACLNNYCKNRPNCDMNAATRYCLPQMACNTTQLPCYYDRSIQYLEYPIYYSDGRGGVVMQDVKTNSDVYGYPTLHGCVCDRTKETTTYGRDCDITSPEDDYNSRGYPRQAAAAKRNLESAQKHYLDLINEFNECTTWTSDINFDTTATYDYDEDYLNKFGLIGRMDRSISTGGGSVWFCNSKDDGSKPEVNDTYTECKNGTTGSAKYEEKHYVYCDTDSCSTSKAQSKQNISKVRYKSYGSSVSAKYKPATLFYNVYPTGEIRKWDDYKNKPDNEQIGVPLENKLPVELSTPRGIYNYVVKFDKLGEFYENNSLGRFAGSEASIIPESSDGINYTCSYLVNMALTSADVIYCDDTCDDPLDCPGECVGPNCDPPCEGTDCIADCVGIGCIYDYDTGSSLLERTVSLNNMFPNGTDAYNWNNEKGLETRSEIQDENRSNGNAIYDEQPILSVTITPSVSSAIRRYNEQQESSGGYSNLTLSCYDLGGFGEAACYSSFIDSLLNGSLGGKAVNSNSKIASSSYRTGTDVSGKAGEYFEMWHKGFSEEAMIGPSWK